ncbi:MAG: hypothetical protein QGI52_07195 [Alphaproteobacteria bacterium]|nr:hypothetical protein [Alphaproteobacteria bacterium]
MTRSERTGGASMHRENARLSRQVADLKRRIEELEQGPDAPLENTASGPAAPAAQDI